MRRTLVSIGVIVLVVLLPAGSWYYLQTGLNYRKQVLVELSPKGDFDTSILNSTDLIKSQTTLFQLSQGNGTIDKKIYDQFGNGETFNLWSSSEMSDNHDNWHFLADSTLENIKRAYPDETFILLDTALQVRNTYKKIDQQAVKKLISHIAIVLPRKKDKDIKMKNPQSN